MSSESNYYNYGDIHIRLVLKGSPSKIAMFHAYCKLTDKDWPFMIEDTQVLPPRCEKCKGYHYRLPLLNPNDLKVIAKQVGLKKCKIISFSPLARCVVKKEKTAPYPDSTPNTPAEEGQVPPTSVEFVGDDDDDAPCWHYRSGKGYDY